MPSTGSFQELYVVEETIGRGSFGEVVRVRRRADGKRLVCKVLRYGSMKEKERQLIVSEVNILRGLRHPNIVRYYDRVIDKRSSKLYILMELCEGGDLGRHIKRKRRDRTWFEENRIWRALAQLLLAFEACHLHKEGNDLRPILHRDIKPCNIFLDSTGNIKVGDFGLAKELTAQDQFATTNVGTPYYMSPELINERRYNEKSDVWSIGCLVYEMATLRPPFEAMNVVSLGKKISAGKFARIPARYSDDLQNVIEMMLTLNPIKRPSVSELKEHPRLARYVHPETVGDIKKTVASTTATRGKASGSDAERRTHDANSERTTMEDYMALRLKEIQKKEQELTKREKELDLREQDILFREKVLEKRERHSLESPTTTTTTKSNSSDSSTHSPSTTTSSGKSTRYKFTSQWSGQGGTSGGSYSKARAVKDHQTPRTSVERKTNVYIDSKRLVNGRSVEEILNAATLKVNNGRIYSTPKQPSISPQEKATGRLRSAENKWGREVLRNKTNESSWLARNIPYSSEKSPF